jgi:hypothetical protein
MPDRCPSLRRLLDHRDGILSRDAAERVNRHLDAGCPACEARIERSGRTIEGLAAGPLAVPPAALVRGAGRLLAKHRRKEAFERIRGAVARLVFDEWVEPAPALRSVPGRSRRMLFAVGESELFVTLTSVDRSWDLEGEVMAPVRELALLRNGEERDRVAVVEDGRFSFGRLAPGAWCLAGTLEGEPFVTDAFVL